MNLFKRYFAGRSEAQEEMLGWPEGDENSRTLFWRRFKRHKLAVAGLVVIGILTLCAIFAPFITAYKPTTVTDSFGAAPSLQHWLGTDQVGRDQLSRLIYAARVSLAVGLGSIVISAVIGTVLGLISGYFGGWIDSIIMRLTDIFMSFPYIMLILVVASIVGPGLTNIILILGVLGWPGVARLVRGMCYRPKRTTTLRPAACSASARCASSSRTFCRMWSRRFSFTPRLAWRARSWTRPRSASSDSAFSRRRRAGATCLPAPSR